MFTNAIVRKPCAEMVNGITTSTLGKPDFEKAQKQHNLYITALRNCGLKVHILEADPKFPDSTFVEDVAVCTPYCGIVTNPGALTRRGERDAMSGVLSGFYRNVHEISSPGTLDAGDVMMVGPDYYIGLSERTNQEGAKQLIDVLRKYNLNGITVKMDKMLHLKTGLSYLENNNLLISNLFINDTTFDKFNKILIDDDEAYSANSVWINGTILVPEGYPRTLEKIIQTGYKTMVIDTSEFRKLDGGLSCLSLRF